MFKTSVLSAIIAGVAFANSAEATSLCGKRADFIKALADKYHEQSKAMGIVGQTNLLEIFTAKSGTWTILMTAPQGKTCIIATGNSWEDLPPTKNLTSL